MLYFNPLLDINCLDHIEDLFEKRYNFKKFDLAYNMSQNKDIFETWMMEESDNIQELSKYYTEYQVVKQFNNQIKLLDDDDELRLILVKLYKLYSYSKIKEDTQFFSLNSFVSKNTLKNVNNKINILNKDLGSISLDLVNSFGIPDWMIHAPMANNWEEYNSYQNNGELN